MQVLDSTEQVVDDMLGVLHLKVDVRFDDFLEVTLCVLHDHIECVKSGGVLGIEQFDELNNERMLEFAHQCHFSQDSFAVCFIFEDVLHSLDSDFLARAFPRGERDLAIAASTKQSFTDVVVAHFPVTKLVQAEIATPTALRRAVGG